MTKWIVVATVLLQTGTIGELPAARQLDDLESCTGHATEILVAYDRMIALEQALADRRCEQRMRGSVCSDEEFRQVVPWIFLGNPRCTEIPTQ